MSAAAWTDLSLDLAVDGVDVRVAALHAPGPDPVVFLHGFGSTKEEYADFTRFPGLAGRGFLAYDAPGFGGSTASDLSAVSVSFLVEVAWAVLAEVGLDRFHLSGHSMGGLTGLLLAHQSPQRVRSFIDIEGNVAPEDCFLSRQIVTHDADDPVEFLARFAARALTGTEFSSALYGSRVLTTVDPEVVQPVFLSMVELSDKADLLGWFTGLPLPRMFMHGVQNSHLTYLPALADAGVEVAAIEHSGHWPMYSNPPAMWARIHDFLTRA